MFIVQATFLVSKLLLDNPSLVNNLRVRYQHTRNEILLAGVPEVLQQGVKALLDGIHPGVVITTLTSGVNYDVR